MAVTYTYNPEKISEPGKDLMRFELGDTMVEGKEKTCALCDEEYNALIPPTVKKERQWKKAKLRCLEGIMRKFAFEPDTKVGPLSLSMGERAKLWKEMHDALKAELSVGGASASAILTQVDNLETGEVTPPYFYAGMMSHEESEGMDI